MLRGYIGVNFGATRGTLKLMRHLGTPRWASVTFGPRQYLAMPWSRQVGARCAVAFDRRIEGPLRPNFGLSRKLSQYEFR